MKKMMKKGMLLGLLAMSNWAWASGPIYPAVRAAEISVRFPTLAPTRNIRYAEHSLPFAMTTLTFDTGANRFNTAYQFNNTMSDPGPTGLRRGGCFELEIKTDLKPVSGMTVNGAQVFKITDNLGVIIQAGSPWAGDSLNRFPQPSVDHTYKQASTGWCSSTGQDYRVKVTPVITSINTRSNQQIDQFVGDVALNERKKILSIRTVKPKTVPPATESWCQQNKNDCGSTPQEYVNRLYNGFTEIIAPEIPVYIEPFTYHAYRMTCVWNNPQDIMDDIMYNAGKKYDALQNFSVNLPTIGINSLKKQREVYGARFSLFWDKNCSKQLDVNGKELVVYTNFTDASNNANNTEILSLDPSSTAKGVGLKIYPGEESQAIRFGAERDLSTQREFLRARTRNVPMTYRVYYAKTSDNIQPGTVKAIAEYTFSYR